MRMSLRAPWDQRAPQNWYLLARSADLKRGAILTRALGDAEIVLYRGRDSGPSRGVRGAMRACRLPSPTRHRYRRRSALRPSSPRHTSRRSIHRQGRKRAREHPAARPAGGRAVQLRVRVRRPGRDVHLPAPKFWHHGPVATRALPPQPLPLPWSTLTSNGMDIDHLQAVHGRKLREPPTFQRLDQRCASELPRPGPPAAISATG